MSLKDTITGAKIDEATREWIMKIAREHGATRSDVIRVALALTRALYENNMEIRRLIIETLKIGKKSSPTMIYAYLTTRLTKRRG